MAEELDQAAGVFLRLVGTGRREEVRQALVRAPGFVNVTGPHPFWGGRPQALHVSIETKQPEMFRVLLDAGADVNGDNAGYDHWSPLMLACQRGHLDMRDELLRRGARVGCAEALLMGDDARVAAFAELPETVPNGGSWLAFARTEFAIDRLLELGAAIDAKDRWGTTPVMAMSKLGGPGRALVRCLLDRGAAAAPEEFARLGDRETLAGLLTADPAAVRRPEVILGAVEQGHRELVEWLLSQGASANARRWDKSRQTALHEAAWNGDLAMAEVLVAAGADVEARDEEHQATPCDWAVTAVRVRNKPECGAVADYLRGLAE